MHGQMSVDTPVGVAAGVVWDVYRGLEVGRLVDELLGDVIGKVQVVEGDGGVGTVVKLTFPPGTPGVGYMKEKITKVDDDNRVKETEVFEGGYIALGFDLHRIRLEVIEKDAKSSIIRSSIEYEVNDELAEIASSITTKQFEMMAEVIGKYLSEKSTATA
ncbi:Bet_v_1 domain-containing protein [Cephalotus follicularis]|uniref:Bet_v_1 domain-containing protein n=1 Tax=Cephalotus follicularis TaxID=3775 RepID=A0A1Q3ATH7_CEPFO|nr:Bet_v_1 domain-containing protein [Cephalotus follicularis]